MSLTIIDRSRFDKGQIADQVAGPSIARIAEVAVPKVLPDDTETILSGILAEPNPYLAFVGMSLDSPFGAEIDVSIAAERQRRHRARSRVHARHTQRCRL